MTQEDVFCLFEEKGLIKGTREVPIETNFGSSCTTRTLVLCHQCKIRIIPGKHGDYGKGLALASIIHSVNTKVDKDTLSACRSSKSEVDRFEFSTLPNFDLIWFAYNVWRNEAEIILL